MFPAKAPLKEIEGVVDEEGVVDWKDNLYGVFGNDFVVGMMWSGWDLGFASIYITNTAHGSSFAANNILIDFDHIDTWWRGDISLV